MEFKIGWHSDIGMRKSTNQDSLAIVEMRTPDGTVLMAMICDGMGGLEKGELQVRRSSIPSQNGLNRSFLRSIKTVNLIQR